MEHAFLVEINTMNYRKWDSNKNEIHGRFVIMESPTQLSDYFPQEKLVQLRTNIRGKESKSDISKSAKKLAKECYNAIIKIKPQVQSTVNPKVNSTEKKVTKSGRLREYFLMNESGSVSDLVAFTGFDEKNLRTAVSILANPGRTKYPIVIQYDSDNKIYKLEKEDECQA